ncbi:hypothetical protein RSAG8_05860, partial [Rhizoctonia solani AG-8 WAC10335]
MRIYPKRRAIIVQGRFQPTDQSGWQSFSHTDNSTCQQKSTLGEGHICFR